MLIRAMPDLRREKYRITEQVLADPVLLRPLLQLRAGDGEAQEGRRREPGMESFAGQICQGGPP